MATQRRQTETAMQMAVVRWARKHAERWPPLHWLYHCANEGKVDPREAGKRQSLGVVAGISDLALPARSGDGKYSGLYLELKKKPNKLTEEQREFLQFAAAQGYATATAYSEEEAIAVIENYLEGTEKQNE